MKVCVINPNFFRSSGVTVAIRRIDAAVRPHGIENYFVSCAYGDDGEDDLSWMPPDRIETLALMSSNPATVWRGVLRLKRLLDAWGIELIHVHHRRLSMLLTAAAPFLKRPVLYSGNLTYGFSAAFWLLSPARAIAVTESVRDNIRATTRTRNIQVLGNPMPFPDHAPAVPEDTPLRAVCVARLAPVKGHRTLIDAWAMLRDRGIEAELVLVGEGPLRQELEAQCQALGLRDRVRFRGYVSDVRGEYDRSLFAILVSAIEGQGIVTIEAASAGRASLLTDVDGSRDCLPAGRRLPNALPYGEADALANALGAWFADPPAAAREGRTFFEFHQRQNSSAALGRRYADIYRETCA